MPLSPYGIVRHSGSARTGTKERGRGELERGGDGGGGVWLGGVGGRGVAMTDFAGTWRSPYYTSQALLPIALPWWSYPLVGLVVKESTSRAEDLGFESLMRRDFFRGRVIPVT